ncbi:MAG: adenosylcobinamide-GDP ribazoletransferase [Heliobacteriaceae bacterium]|nr:adenosylcobinamide-GDP ribazoletransferase [Heliobacteriaceae bacterium]
MTVKPNCRLACGWLRFRLALTFFTRLPAGSPADGTEEDFGRSFVYLPLVGLVVGSLLALIAGGLACFFPPVVLAPLVLALAVYLTGGIHFDGFMDTFDGIFSGRNPERMLEIMRDSRVGAHAVTAVIILVLVKTGAVYALAGPPSPGLPGVGEWDLWSGFFGHHLPPLYITLVLTPVAGRWAIMLAAGWFPYARAAGMASVFHRYLEPRVLWRGSLITGAIFAVLAGIGGLVVLGATAGLVYRWGTYLCGRLGGLTGDTYGATCELVEVFCLLVAVAFFG